jgi:RimJ/RimL family protein N-acetyltransferase
MHGRYEERISMISSDRICLVPMSRREAEAIVGAIREGRNWADGYPTDGDVIVAHQLLNHDPESSGTLYQVLLTDTELVIGGIGFKAPPDSDGTAEIGYGIAPEYQGRGLATEAVVAILGAAADDPAISLVFAEVENDNTASCRVAEKAGMRLARVEGDRRYYEWSA